MYAYYSTLSVHVTHTMQHIYMGVAIGKARKKYGVKYPTLYADESTNKQAKEFNCVQRGHQNSLENEASFLSLLLIAGARYPISASVAGMLYLAGRVCYFQGYCSGEPQNRMRGAFLHFGTLALLGMAARFGVELLMTGR